MSHRIAVESLTVEIGNQVIVTGVTFAAMSGEVIGIVGTSGSGKSMTALALTGLLPPEARVSGRLRLDHESFDARHVSSLRGKRIGIVFQEPATALNPLMKIGDQVAESIRLHSDPSHAGSLATARRLLARVGLPESLVPADRYPHELSGGQRQRVAIAIALAASPRILIADEPTTALDVTTQHQILALLQEIASADGLTVILISHDLAIIRQVSTQIIVMSGGRVVEQGLTNDILRQPQHPVTHELFENHAPPIAPAPQATGPVVLQAQRVGRVRHQNKKSRKILEDIHFRVHAGERVGIVGESGSGKSTLVRILLGLESPDSGVVELGGQPFDRANVARTRQQRQLVQAVFQDPVSSLNPKHSIEKIVGEPLALLEPNVGAAERAARIRKSLDEVGLGTIRLTARPHEFSGGQRQRIALARALVANPQLLVLDEAVSALDAATRNEILRLILALWASRGLGFLLVSHDLSVIRSVTDRICVLAGGVIVEEGATDAVLSQPEHPYTRQLVAATPTLFPLGTSTSRNDHDDPV